MYAIKFLDEDKPAAFIKKSDGALNLAQIRNVISEEHDDFPPYKFIFCGTDLNTIQESFVQLSDVLETCSNTGFDKQLTLNRVAPQSEPTIVDSVNVPSFISDVATSQTTKSYAASDASQQSLFYSLPPKKDIGGSCSLTLFENSEIINEQDDMQRHFKVFYNKMATKIDVDHRFKLWGNQEKDGLIDVTWTKKKTSLLESKVKQLKLNYISFELASVDKNLDTLLKTAFTVEADYESFCSKLDIGKESRRDLEADFDQSFSRLKKAQADLKKALSSVKKKELSNVDDCNESGDFDADAALKHIDTDGLADNVMD